MDHLQEDEGGRFGEQEERMGTGGRLWGAQVIKAGSREKGGD